MAKNSPRRNLHRLNYENMRAEHETTPRGYLDTFGWQTMECSTLGNYSPCTENERKREEGLPSATVVSPTDIFAASIVCHSTRNYGETSSS